MLVNFPVIIVDVVVSHIRVTGLLPLRHRRFGQVDVGQIQADGKPLPSHTLGQLHQAFRLFVKHAFYVYPKLRKILQQLSEILLVPVHPAFPVGFLVKIRNKICVDNHSSHPQLQPDFASLPNTQIAGFPDIPVAGMDCNVQKRPVQHKPLYRRSPGCQRER